jgi:hypothetical protein
MQGCCRASFPSACGAVPAAPANFARSATGPFDAISLSSSSKAGLAFSFTSFATPYGSTNPARETDVPVKSRGPSNRLALSAFTTFEAKT